MEGSPLPFKSKSQMRACFAKREDGEAKGWNCDEWAHSTPNLKSLPDKKGSHGSSLPDAAVVGLFISSKQAAVREMANYVSSLAYRQGVKQANVSSVLFKLASNLYATQSLPKALQMTYPKANQTWIQKVSSSLVKGLISHLRKRAEIMGSGLGDKDNANLHPAPTGQRVPSPKVQTRSLEKKPANVPGY